MKNIHVLSTEKPSRILRGLDGIRIFENEVSPDNEWCVNVNIHITNDEEIKDGDKRINNYQRKPKGEEIPSKKIILTTDQDLIKNGVQTIDDEFLEWFVKNPSCEFAHLGFKSIIGDSETKRTWKIIIPKEEPKKLYDLPLAINNVTMSCTSKPKQETLEEASEKWVFETNGHKWSNNDDTAGDNYGSFIAGSKWQQEQYEILFDEYHEYTVDCIEVELKRPLPFKNWFKQFKKK